MVKINKIYTKTGDNGTTGLVGGSRIHKTAPRIHACGEVDELNCWLGYLVSISDKKLFKEVVAALEIIQNELFDIGSELASPAGSHSSAIPLVSEERVYQIEKWIDQFVANLPELRSFILPGGNLTTSSFHIARAVARRAERSVLLLHEQEPVRDTVRHYFNRLSDLLFACGRFSAYQLGTPEVLWVPEKTRS